MRMVLSILALVLLTSCVSRRNSDEGISGVTDDGPARCQVHDVLMSLQTVDLKFGGQGAFTETDRARRRLFPHAAEPYNTGWCNPSENPRGPVLVCPRCTEARDAWFTAHAPKSK